MPFASAARPSMRGHFRGCGTFHGAGTSAEICATAASDRYAHLFSAGSINEECEPTADEPSTECYPSSGLTVSPPIPIAHPQPVAEQAASPLIIGP
jgi:hypothetical protein